MHHTKSKRLLYLILISFLISCEGEVGPQGIGLNSLTTITDAPIGENCENGGVKIEVGTDHNENGVLDVEEIQSTSYVCNGVDGEISLTTVTTESAGTSCQNGGLRIDSGVDSNGDGTLDDIEISATAYVCNGIDGNSTLTKITNEASGTNCENGGLRIDSGVDSNGDGTLEDLEISTTAYVCNGIDGNSTLTKITNEESGTNCENGGLRIDSGVDSNGDGTLDDIEISATAYVCNRIDGNSTLTKITNEASATNCENGGLRIDSGVDSNGDGTLEDIEISATAYVCNGIDGINSLIMITSEAAGTNCEAGGIKIESGIDNNSNSELDEEEIATTEYVCNGLVTILPISGMIAYYPFNGNALDESGNSLNGEIIGATLTSDRNGKPNQAFSFDGIDDRIEVANNSLLESQTFSLSVWFRALNDRGAFVSMSDFNPIRANTGYYLSILNGNLRGLTNIGSGSWARNVDDGVVSLDEWHHVVFTFNGTYLELFLDGDLVSTLEQQHTVNYSEHNPLQIGTYYSPSGETIYTGDMDDIRIFDRALDENEVKALYHE